MTARKRAAVNWIVLFLLGCVVAGGLFWLSRGRACDEWQEDYRVALEADEQPTGGVFSFINQGPTDRRLSELRDERPAGCSTPESP